MPVPAKIVVELMAWNETGPDPAGHRSQLPVADQSANLVLGATEFGRNLADGQGCGRSMPEPYAVTRSAYAAGMWDILTWHHGTLAIAWWAVIVLIVALLSIGGTAAARRR